MGGGETVDKQFVDFTGLFSPRHFTGHRVGHHISRIVVADRFKQAQYSSVGGLTKPRCWRGEVGKGSGEYCNRKLTCTVSATRA